ncbi:MAG: FtsX-like permease family protein [Desulfobacterales bacterium]|nr:MAG: FtsX-like permease family protein [Desulfobacterales bacterium]
MKFRSSYPFLAWTVRDILRQPLEAILLFLSLASLATVLGTALLLSQSLSHTAQRILQDAPSLVIRRVGVGGWAPMPVQESIRLAKSVAGVIGARARIWGTVNGPAGPLTVFGINQPLERGGLPDTIPLPSPGQAILGPGVMADTKADVIKLSGINSVAVKVAAVLDSRTSMAIHDVVLLHPEDARQILGIAAGYASDVAVDVFHESEAEAVLPDLARAYPWPVRLITRREAAGIYSAGLARRSGLAYLALVPALLALAFIVLGAYKNQNARRYEVGLYKAFGWTTPDIFRLHLLKALMIGGPAMSSGLILAYGLVLRPGVSWPGYLLLGWKQHPPLLHLDASGALLVLLEIALLVFLPYLAATLWPAIKAATTDPQDFLEREFM